MTHANDRQLFVDTSALFAIGYRQDSNFRIAQRIFARLAASNARLVTTPYIVAEAHALFLARGGRHAGVQFLRWLDGSVLRIVWPDVAQEAAARDIIYRYTDKSFSLTDAISFVVMEQLGISTAFTFDRDFEQYGFTIARP